MKKRKNLSVVNALLQLLFVAVGAVFAIQLFDVCFINRPEGLAGLVLIILLPLFFIALVYTFAGLIPLLLKSIYIRKPKKPLIAVSLPFDILFTLINTLLVISSVSGIFEGGEESVDALITLVLPVALFVLTIFLLILDIMLLKIKPEIKEDTPEQIEEAPATE